MLAHFPEQPLRVECKTPGDYRRTDQWVALLLQPLKLNARMQYGREQNLKARLQQYYVENVKTSWFYSRCACYVTLVRPRSQEKEMNAKSVALANDMT
ncbi:unnamed protein product [Litomosoides sigmodontis]|uniref:Uncharacterized protein n=1 Tax=Litomosoides sigmodontis TaxID=42156 RepID=A0A3P6SQ03_LITSI|nr:unnamed protein product [Litomosoides sigmodontis]